MNLKRMSRRMNLRRRSRRMKKENLSIEIGAMNITRRAREGLD